MLMYKIDVVYYNLGIYKKSLTVNTKYVYILSWKELTVSTNSLVYYIFNIKCKT